MADAAFVLTVVAFLGLCVLYVRGCDRIVASAEDDTATEVSDGR